ncbi:hypothetical protein ABPG77_002326 [Micractinium sp. CCAP 211/92]
MEELRADEGWLLPLEELGEVIDPLELGCGDELFVGGAPSSLQLLVPLAAPSSGIASEPRTKQQRHSGAASAEVVHNEELDRQRLQSRAKQARYRQQQREKQQELEQQYESYAAELERERQLNEAMRLSGSVLEALKDQKEDCVAVLQAAAAARVAAAEEEEALAKQQQQQEQPRMPHQAPVVVEELPVQSAGEATQADSSTSGSGILRSSQPSSPQASASSCAGERGSGAASRIPAFDSAAGRGPGRPLPRQRFISLAFEERVELCMRSLQRTRGAPPALQGGAAVDSFALSMPEKQVLVEATAGSQPQLLQAVLSMTADDVLEDWGDLGEFAAEVLYLLDRGRIGQEEATERLRPAVLYMVLRNAILMSHRPEHFLHLLQHTRLRGESELAATKRWRQVMLSLGFTREEALACLPHYQAYCEQMLELGEEAATTLATLQELQQSLGKLGDTLSSLAEQFLGLMEAASTLSQQPSTALLAIADYYTSVGAELSEDRKLRTIAACRPLQPDMLQVVRAALLHYDLMPEELRGLEPPLPRPAALPSPATGRRVV